LAEIAKRLPKATVCLLSALVFHGVTVQIPSEVWVALPRASRTPRLDNRKMRLVRFSGPALTEGRAEHRIEAFQ
jgi:predicted transcriptional regulator of viral defense system